MKKAYGYMRLSPGDAENNEYRAKLMEAGAAEDRIFTDMILNTSSDCPAFKELLALLKPGDLLFIISLNQLGINCDETAERWRIITKERGCDLAVLDMPLIDTRCGDEIKDLVLQVFDCVTSIRKNYSHQRQAEGIKSAKERNVSFGRHAKPIPKKFNTIAGLYEKKQISARAASERLNVSSDTFLKWYRNTKAPDCKSEKEQTPINS